MGASLSLPGEFIIDVRSLLVTAVSQDFHQSLFAVPFVCGTKWQEWVLSQRRKGWILLAAPVRWGASQEIEDSG